MDSSPDRRFRRNFVLALTVAFALGFLALIAGFLDALLRRRVLDGLLRRIGDEEHVLDPLAQGLDLCRLDDNALLDEHLADTGQESGPVQ